MRRIDGRLVVASGNDGKIREIRDLLAPFDIDSMAMADLGLDEPVEDGDSFEANADIKSRAAAMASGHVALADDSGLAVDALGGQPGIHSARWAGPDKDFDRAMRLVEEALQSKGAVPPERRAARFVAVLSLCWPDGEIVRFRGECPGRLVWPPRGEQGFGYDPMFLPDGHDRTFGEMTASEKHGWRPGERTGLSHRARAFEKLYRALLAHGDGKGTGADD